MLVDKTQPERRDVPHERDQGHWIEFCRVSWMAMDQARRARERDQREVMKELGPEMMRALTEGSDDERRERARRTLDELQYHESNFDTKTLLKKGISGWSYDAEVTDEAIELLDERTAVWAKNQVIELNRPETEDELGEGSGGSLES